MFLNPGYFRWLYFKQKKHLWFNLGIGILYWVYIGMSLPFGISSLSSTNFFTLIFVLFPLALIWPLVSYGLDGILKASGYYDKLTSIRLYWSLFVKVLVFVHLILVARGILCFWSCINLKIYGIIWLESIVLLVLVYLPFSFVSAKMFRRKRKLLDEKNLESLFKFNGELRKSISIDLSRLIYIKSDDKYVEFYLSNTDKEPDKVLFRASLKSIENQLKEESDFIRIHRSYIINFKYLLSLSRVSEIKVGYQSFNVVLPISKSYKGNLPELKI